MSREIEQSFTDAICSVVDPLRAENERYRKALERILDVAKRYQENNTSRGSVGLGNVQRFAQHALGK
jgi:hypothetical protein